MANIPVEKKDGSPAWLWWILGALALIALLFLLGRGCEDDVVEDPYMADTTATVTSPETDMLGSGATIMTVDDLVARASSGNVIGERVRFENATVTEVIADSTFYLGDGTGQVLVVLEELGEAESGPGDGSDGRYNIDQGQVLTLDGRVESLDSSGVTRWGAAGAAAERDFYVRARRITDQSTTPNTQ